MIKLPKLAALLLLCLASTTNAQETAALYSPNGQSNDGMIKEQPARMLYADTLLNKVNEVENIIVLDDNNESYTFSEGQLGEDEDFSGTTAMISSNDDYFLSEVGYRCLKGNVITIPFFFAVFVDDCMYGIRIFNRDCGGILL